MAIMTNGFDEALFKRHTPTHRYVSPPGRLFAKNTESAQKTMPGAGCCAEVAANSRSPTRCSRTSRHLQSSGSAEYQTADKESRLQPGRREDCTQRRIPGSGESSSSSPDSEEWPRQAV